MRVLQTDSKKRKLMLTHKKTLINTKLKVISSYSVQAGTVAHGFITGFRKSGIVVNSCTDLQMSVFPAFVATMLPITRSLCLDAGHFLCQRAWTHIYCKFASAASFE